MVIEEINLVPMFIDFLYERESEIMWLIQPLIK